MKKSIFTLSSLLITGALFSQALSAQSLTGYDIIKKANEVPEAKTASSTATLTIHSKKVTTEFAKLS